jgi:glyoxylase-like metal-dependent hydrolase (beta-lactamase superfamily II)
MNNVKYLFTGDTLFEDGVGRTDFAYSSSSDLAKSLKKIKSTIYNAKCEILIYSGHENSPFFLSDLASQ